MSDSYTRFDHEMMSLALKLAQKGHLSTRPNPRVGCVITKDQSIVGQGWHEKVGSPHAEINALNEAGSHAKGATAYVTLEPCSHTGRTPPCCNALIAAGVSKVITAMEDPNPQVSGRGIKALQEAGIDVSCGLLEPAARKLNQGFIQRMTSGKPFVRCKMAMSLDGRTAMKSGESQWITSPSARLDGQRLRAQSGAIITGIGTVIADNPQMNVRDDAFIATGISQPLRVILDSQLQIDPTSKILNPPSEALIAHVTDNMDKKAKLDSLGVTTVQIPGNNNQVDLSKLLNYLASNHDINDVLVEAGAQLAGAFLNLGLVDELTIYMAPSLLGSDARGLVALPGLKKLADKIEIAITDIRPIGPDWRIIADCKKGY